MAPTSTTNGTIDVYPSVSYFFDNAFLMKLDIPQIKAYLKSPSFDNICSVTVSELLLDIDSVEYKAKDSLRMTIDKIVVRDLMHYEEVGSIDDLKLHQTSDRNDDLCMIISDIVDIECGKSGMRIRDDTLIQISLCTQHYLAEVNVYCIYA